MDLEKSAMSQIGLKKSITSRLVRVTYICGVGDFSISKSCCYKVLYSFSNTSSERTTTMSIRGFLFCREQEGSKIYWPSYDCLSKICFKILYWINGYMHMWEKIKKIIGKCMKLILSLSATKDLTRLKIDKTNSSLAKH